MSAKLAGKEPTRTGLGVEGISLADASPWALFLTLCVAIVMAVIRGDLVPRKTHEDAIHNGEMWRAAHMISEQARQEERDQKKELMEHARTTTAIVSALPPPADKDE